MANFKFAKIVIIESIPDGQFHSGAALYGQIEAQLRHYERPVTCQYIAVKSRKEFRKEIEKVGKAATEEGRIPLLQVECHGNDDGLELLNGDRIPWPLLCAILFPLNQMTGLNLFVCISACFGAFLLKEYMVFNPAPFFGLLSATEEQGPDELFRGFSAFYRVLIETLDGDKATAAVRENAPKFYLTDVLGHFVRSYRAYLANYCTDEMYWERAEKVRQIDLRKAGTAGTIYFYYERLKAQEMDKIKNAMEIFFMLKQFPENVDRFPVTLADLGR